MSSSKKLFLLDAYALIFRGYYAFIKNPRINSKGMDTSAIMGFMNSLLDVIKREKPNHLAVAFDKGGSAERSGLFPEYKQNRDVTPEAIKIAVPYIHEILKAMHIPVIEKEGFEADDLIGTLSVQAEKAGYTTYMVTPDKDFAQLVTENTFVYRPAANGNGVEIWDVEKVKEKFDVDDPKKVTDFLGMMGDAIDNIPGLPGVGDKTARKFLKEFGSLENLLANTDKLQGKMKEKIEENAELGLLSKKLATIITNCPVEFHEKDFELNSPDVDKITTIFQELEFRRLLESVNQIFSQNKTYMPLAGQEEKVQTVPNFTSQQLDFFSDPVELQSDTNSDTDNRSIDSHDHLYQTVDTLTAHKLLVNKLLKQKTICFDTETTSLNSLLAQLVGISFSYEKGKGYYAVIPEDRKSAQQILEIYRPFFENEGIVKVGQNLKYDIKVLDKYAIRVKGPVFDTMIAHYLLNPDMRHNMDILAETYLHYQPIPIENLIGKKGKNQGSMRDVPLDLQTEYAVEDADITWQLHNIFSGQLKKDNLSRLYEDIEAPLIKVLADMEIEGIRMDEKVLSGLSVSLTEDIKSLENKIYGQAKTEFNLASPKQLGTVLFEELKLIEKPTKTKTGQYATGEEILSKLAFKHPIVAEILEWRGLVKLKNTYVDSLPNEVNAKTGRIHTTFSQAVASTGRLSSNNPNLQNIPIRTERGKEIRKAFVPRDNNYLLLSADYSQIELRLIAELSGDEELKSAFLRGEDIHRSTASKVFNVPLELVTREQRSYAKTVNFGIIYGVSAFGLSQQTDLSQKESKELIDTYFRTYPTLQNYIQSQIEFARKTGYVETILGRRRYLKNINSANAVVRSGDERNAVNAPIQGSAADIIKIAMIRIHEQLEKEKLRSKMILQVHDELVFDVLKEELKIVMPIVKHAMENAYPLSIPLIVDAGAGENWLEAH